MWLGLRRDAELFWRITRPGNLLIAAVTFAVATFLSSQRSFSFVADEAFWGELVIIIVIMAAGYWVNDAYDYKIDRINKPQRTVVGPHLSRKKVLSVYFAVNWLAMTASLALPPKFILVNGCAAVSLYLYASYFKRTAVVGNLIVASLTALVVLAGALLYHLKLALLWGMVFAFLITFLREVTKDIEDIRGDLQHGLHTLPILVGIRGAKWVLLIGHVLTIVACWVPVVVHPLMGEPRVAPYAFASLMLVQIPLGYVLVLLRTARRPTDFGPQATVLKAVIAGGLVSLLLLPG